MAKVTYQDGTVITFDGTPTEADIEEAYSSVKGSSKQTPKQSDVLPTVSQIAGNIAGFSGGALLGHPYIGSAIGGTAGRIAGRLGQQNIDLMQRNPMQELALQSPLAAPIMPLRAVASMTPKQRGEFGKEIRDTAIGEAIAVPIGYGIGKGLQGIGKLINLGGRKTAQAIAQKADKGLDVLQQNLSSKYDALFAKVGKGEVANNNVFNSVREAVDAFPEGAGSGKLKQILARLADVDNISAKELHNLKQEVSKMIPKSVWSGITEGNAIQNAYENIYWTISGELEKIGGKAYQGLTQEYKGFKQAERLAKKLFFRQGIPSNEALRGVVDIPTEKAIRSLSKQLPKTEQFAQAFEAWRRGQGVKKALRVGVGGGALAYALHRYLTGKLLGNKEY